MEPILEVVPTPAMVPDPIMVPAPAWNRLQLRLFESNGDSDSGIINYWNHNSSTSYNTCTPTTALAQQQKSVSNDSQLKRRYSIENLRETRAWSWPFAGT